MKKTVRITTEKIFSCLIIILCSALSISDCKKCEDPRFREESIVVDDSSKLPPYYTCPRAQDPDTLTECCWDGGCCPKYIPAMYQIDDWVIMVTAIVVIISCILFTVIILVCCFWSKCPFYDTCRVNYNNSDIIIYTMTQDDDPCMPLENSMGKQYSPSLVKVKPVEEV